MDEARELESQQVLMFLEALKLVSQDVQKNPTSRKGEPNSSAIKALLELENEADNILCNDPELSNLYQHLVNLKTLVGKLQQHRHRSLQSFLYRQVSNYEISRIAGCIENEIQAWIDRESIENLLRVLQDSVDDDEKIKLVMQFEARVSQGFNRDLQDLILKSKVFSALESVLCDSNSSKRIRDQSAFAVKSLVRFNRDVFVGQVLMGPTVRSLISMGSPSSIQVLYYLIKSIKTPLVDELESNGEIPRIIGFLSSKDLSIRVTAMDCVLEIAYFGRKEAIEAMLKEGLISRLVGLQRSELGGCLIEMGPFEENENKVVCAGGVEKEPKGKRKSRERRFLERHPFASCVTRFAVQLEMGGGLGESEKRSLKQEILRSVREDSVSDAEVATIFAELLWGSSP